MNFTNSLIYKLHSVTYSLDSIADSILKESFNISYSQFLVLLGVLCGEKVNQKYLENYTLLTNAAISKIISFLLIKKLIVREVSIQNRRENQITLTSSGKILVEKSINALEENFKKYIKEISAKGEKSMIKNLDNILKYLNS